MSLVKENSEVYYNTKTKVYRTGATTSIYCRQYIFKDSSAEDVLKRHDDKFKFECSEVQSSKRIQKVRDAAESMATILSDDYRNIVSGAEIIQQLEKVHSEPRLDNLKHAIDCVFDIVYQNEWDLFLTLTLRPDDSLDRTDPKEVMKPLRNWLSDHVKRKGLRYILIPEEHKNGGIHAHMLCNDVFQLVDSGTKTYTHFKRPMMDSTALARGLNPEDGQIVYNVPEWRYGFTTAIKVYGDSGKLAFYLTKYLTKDMKKIFGKYYWSSKNIVRKPQIILSNSDYDAVQAPEYGAFKYDSDLLLNQEGAPGEHCSPG